MNDYPPAGLPVTPDVALACYHSLPVSQRRLIDAWIACAVEPSSSYHGVTRSDDHRKESV